MKKRSISIKGHRTSIRLEAEFWTALDAAAASRRISLPLLIERIDAERMVAKPPPGLASALRVFALREAASGVRDET
jgi:predicted DNA-binding ribbon-helix-helix protein